jgi:hypothetical protein
MLGYTESNAAVQNTTSLGSWMSARILEGPITEFKHYA